MRLPDQPNTYDQFIERQRSLALEQADSLNRKKKPRHRGRWRAHHFAVAQRHQVQTGGQ